MRRSRCNESVHFVVPSSLALLNLSKLGAALRCAADERAASCNPRDCRNTWIRLHRFPNSIRASIIALLQSYKRQPLSL